MIAATKNRWDYCAILAWAAVLLCPAAALGQNQIQVDVVGSNGYNVFVPGESFQFDVRPNVVSGTAPGDLAYQWVDYQGSALSAPVALTAGQLNTIASPLAAMDIGYYGLRFIGSNTTFNPNSSNHNELGFSVLPEIASRTVDPSSFFGMVHHDYFDPYVDPGWIKTRTNVHARNLGTNVVNATDWMNQIGVRYDQGQLEVPIVNVDPWPTDDTLPVGQPQLDELQSMFEQYMAADARVPAWELGVEEQLSHSVGDDPLYFDNLLAKFQTFKAARDRVFPAGGGPKLVYQVVNFDEAWLDALFSHAAGDEIDVLSVHPYAWPDFPDPEAWHDSLLNSTRGVLSRNGHGDLPIWYTESGAPQNDAGVPQMLSGAGTPVDARSRADEPRFMVKMHVLAADAGVEHFFWYNYRDRGPDLTDVEDHFGLVDHWRNPKPAYAAYGNMVNQLKGKTLESSAITADGARIFRYVGDGESVTVAWSPEGTSNSVSADVLLGISGAAATSATNIVGSPLALGGGDISIGEDPTYIVGPRGGIVPDGIQVNVDFQVPWYSGRVDATGDDGVPDLQGDGSNQWNVLSRGGGDDLVDSDGNPTTIGFHFDAPETQYGGWGKPDAGLDDVAREEIHNDLARNEKWIDFTIGGLESDGTAYDLYLIVPNIWNGIDMAATVYGMTQETTIDGPYSGGPLEENVDYLVFEGLIPNANGEINGRVHHIAYLTWDSEAYISGLQLVSRPLAALAATPGDFDSDGDVDGDDFLIWQSNFGSLSPTGGDADADGDVDGDDFLIWQSNFGSGGTGATLVPEPHGAMLIAMLLFSLAVSYSKHPD